MPRKVPAAAHPSLFGDLFVVDGAAEEPVPDEPLQPEEAAIAQAYQEAVLEATAADVAAVETYAGSLEPPAVWEAAEGLEEAAQDKAGFAIFGRNLFGDDIRPPSSGALFDRFILPPFTVLDARQGLWQDRKRAWLMLGLQSEIGRADNLLGISPYARFKRATGIPYTQSRAIVQAAQEAQGEAFDLAALITLHGGTPLAEMPAPQGGRLMGAEKFPETGPRDSSDAARQAVPGAGECGTSIFDPVLCELVYRWFVPPDGCILDPFAGGSVRGIVAAKLALQYVGIELRPEQLEANQAQAAAICAGDALMPSWVEGDGLDAPALTDGMAFDFLFACPPYGDLERYSDDPRDLSTMDWPGFRAAYRHIIAAAVSCLRPDRFACFVVGDIRDAKGLYRGLPELTVEAFAAAGMAKYNEGILITSVGSLGLRVGRQFNSGRKLGKSHQQVLVFVKGDPRKAAAACNGAKESP